MSCSSQDAASDALPSTAHFEDSRGMPNPVLHRLNEATFIELILFDELRHELLTFLGGSSSDVRSTAALIAAVAKKCVATPDQLRKAIRLLEAEDRSEAKNVLLELLFHSEVPEDVLSKFAEEGKFISALGQRSGPRHLLEILAGKHRYPQAITTLALNCYGAKDQPARPFREFLERYKEIEMLEYHLRRATSLDKKKQEIVREVFGDDRTSPPSGHKTRRR
jgi:hypothetical protein